ncbi:hypothetical protein [uncultured Kordia sp.]|uniref:hypothetical protein n=1 Tax=uncultured Kordia sp. TaxID=507699 RepID=UPI00262CEFCE|nr:hypothetical protein [uncultured Kordia sp.]
MKTIPNALLTGIIFAFVVSVIIYTALAGMYAWDWAIDISRSFGLLIIRAIVVIFLTIPSLFMIPFQDGIEIISVIKIPALIAFGIGFLYGLSIKK